MNYGGFESTIYKKGFKTIFYIRVTILSQMWNTDILWCFNRTVLPVFFMAEC